MRKYTRLAIALIIIAVIVHIAKSDLTYSPANYENLCKDAFNSTVMYPTKCKQLGASQ